MTDREFWWAHLRAPLFAFIILAVICESTTLDGLIAHAYFYDASRRAWLGANNWWANEFLHTGGRWAIRLVVAVALAMWTGSFFAARLRPLRRSSGYLSLGMVASIAIVGLLKVLTNIDCPWDLAQFGGDYPWVRLFADRPDTLRHASCFPAAHASSGYALMALYFVLHERHRGWAQAGLALGLCTGIAFGIAQQARGAHFLSHDVWSAFLVWLTLLSLYAFGFKQRLRHGASRAARIDRQDDFEQRAAADLGDDLQRAAE
jgi:membrane-associated PAP2 superfamily phosphatase